MATTVLRQVNFQGSQSHTKSHMKTALREVAALEGGRVLNDRYTFEEYVKRRGQYLATHPIYTHRTGLFNIARTSAQEVFNTERENLSVQETRRREIDKDIAPLLPLPTTENTETITDHNDYPGSEWEPTMAIFDPLDAASALEFRGVTDSANNTKTTMPYEQTAAINTDNMASSSPLPSESLSPSMPELISTRTMSSSPLQDREDMSSRLYEGIRVPQPDSILLSEILELLGQPWSPPAQADRSSTPAHTLGEGTTSKARPEVSTSLYAHKDVSSLSKRGMNVKVKTRQGLNRALSAAPEGDTDTDVGETAAPPPKKLKGNDGTGTKAGTKIRTRRTVSPTSNINEESEVTAASTNFLPPPSKKSKANGGKATVSKIKRGTKRAASSPPAIEKHMEEGTISTSLANDSLPPQKIPRLKKMHGPKMPEGRSTLSNGDANDSQTMGQASQDAFSKHIEKIISGQILPRTHGEANDAAKERYARLVAQRNARIVSLTDGTSEISRTPDILPEFFKAEHFPEENGDDQVRCVCCVVEDDGKNMIACDKCGVWQHQDKCMGEAVPKDKKNGRYLCHVCAPWAHRKLIAELRRANPLCG
ncbi:hypothetical protein LTR37_012630 [Vermiconidia calcicola]|uniref:Uncharacterized protein n=1 Tax=Vermiconidia calcicola TaxID=1690605 RepID=A0ACC3MYM8_9PEZI|nr:hypothetical protein LTR37_012630 [Vermiconidia calcicola]